MQFIDHALITIKSGDGGNGCAAFHREKYVARGGPSGGDGGRGGDVILEADARMTTLYDYKYRRQYLAQRGEDGKGEMMSGKDGEPLILHVPVGTVARDVQTGAILADMREDKKQRLLIKGGRGGRGNARFKTPTRRAPRFAEPGRKTLPREVELTLLTIADVGLIGMPNAGKSTLLSVLTAARPKIADYPFTTLSPNLGVARRHEKSVVLADIPGLIEGAAEGVGLGHDFLRHIERTRVLVHVLDMSGGFTGRDPVEDYHAVNKELTAYGTKLASLPQLVAANKMDLTDAGEALETLQAALPNARIFPVSAVAHKGLDMLMDAVVTLLDTLPPTEEYIEEEIELAPAYAPGFEVEKTDGAAYLVTGGDVERILDTTDPHDEASMRRFQQLLVKTGIIEALREAGAVDGSAVIMGEWEFDFIN